MTEVSIIIPYNKDRGYLEQAIESAELQSFRDIEVLTWWGRHNLSKNINDALKKAKGEYIKILSEDDLLPIDSIEILYNAIQGHGWVVGDAQNFGLMQDGWEHYPMWQAIKPDLLGMIRRNQIHGGTTMYRKDLLLKVGGYDETLHTGEEYDLHLKLIANGYHPAVASGVVYKYRLHTKNKSMNLSVEEKEERRQYITDTIKTRYYDKI